MTTYYTGDTARRLATAPRCKGFLVVQALYHFVSITAVQEREARTQNEVRTGFDTKFHRLPLIFFLVNFSCQPLRDYLPTLSCSRTCRAPFRLIFILLLAKFFFSSLFLFFINLHPLHTTFTHVIYTYIFIHAQGASANAGENFPAKTASHPGKRLRWCCSVLWDIFNRIHSSFNTLVV